MCMFMFVRYVYVHVYAYVWLLACLVFVVGVVIFWSPQVLFLWQAILVTSTGVWEPQGDGTDGSDA